MLMSANQAISQRVQVIDSHTAGEPTRVVVEGGPDLGNQDLKTRLDLFRSKYDSFRSGVVCEPRGSEVIVGALLCKPVDPSASAGVIFFNDVGYLGMCGHGTIGLITTLAHMGQIKPGKHKIETPVGDVSTTLHEDGRVSVENVPSYRYKASVPVEVPGYGSYRGDIVWSGNWFFLVEEHQFEVTLENRAELLAASKAIRSALIAAGITGEDGGTVDHVEFFGPPINSENHSRNFVLCPGASFDRSPCGTGTSGKMASLFAKGKLKAGETWRQEGILGTLFEGSVSQVGDKLLPTITGRAWVTAESTLLFDPTDPFRAGIPF
jgi:4-hydroxyproline epimerase